MAKRLVSRKDNSIEKGSILYRSDDRIARCALAAPGTGDRTNGPDSLFCELRSSSRPVSKMGCHRSSCVYSWQRCGALVFEITRKVDHASRRISAI